MNNNQSLPLKYTLHLNTHVYEFHTMANLEYIMMDDEEMDAYDDFEQTNPDFDDVQEAFELFINDVLDFMNVVVG